MRAAYYPGCSLQGTAKDYDDSVRGICKNLGIQLDEISDWNCCGATAAHSIHHSAAIELAARNLHLAAKMPHRDMLVPCPMCYNRLMTATSVLKAAPDKNDPSKRSSSTPKIWDLANFFASEPVLETVVKNIKYPLNGLKVVCYYGCMASRPPEITRASDFENPQSLDRIVHQLGATAMDWPYKTDCCGATQVLSRRDMVLKLIKPLLIWPGRWELKRLWCRVKCVRPTWICFKKQWVRRWGYRFPCRFIIFLSSSGWPLGKNR